MKISISLFFVLFSAVFIILPAQFFSVKPYIGYGTVDMSEVNNDTQERLGSLVNTVEHPLKFPEEFSGNYAWGVQFQYHAGDNYFFNLNTYYSRESTEVTDSGTLASDSWNFFTRREIIYFEVGLGLKYFINYSSLRRVSYYLGGGFGIGFGWANSDLKYNGDLNRVDNQTDFSSNALIAYFSAGFNIRLTTLLSLNPEIGYRVADLQQMDGRLKVDQQFPKEPDKTINAIDDNFVTEEFYDFSGFFFTIGLGFNITFLE